MGFSKNTLISICTILVHLVIIVIGIIVIFKADQVIERAHYDIQPAIQIVDDW